MYLFYLLSDQQSKSHDINCVGIWQKKSNIVKFEKLEVENICALKMTY